MTQERSAEQNQFTSFTFKDDDVLSNRTYVSDDEEEEPEYPYYWKRQSNENAESPNIMEKAWHWTHFISSQTYKGMEFSGEVIATILGLTRSKYQWVLDAQEREEAEKALHRLEDRQRKQMQLEALLEKEKAKLKSLEAQSEFI